MFLLSGMRVAWLLYIAFPGDGHISWLKAGGFGAEGRTQGPRNRPACRDRSPGVHRCEENIFDGWRLIWRLPGLERSGSLLEDIVPWFLGDQRRIWWPPQATGLILVVFAMAVKLVCSRISQFQDQDFECPGHIFWFSGCGFYIWQKLWHEKQPRLRCGFVTRGWLSCSSCLVAMSWKATWNQESTGCTGAMQRKISMLSIDWTSHLYSLHTGYLPQTSPDVVFIYHEKSNPNTHQYNSTQAQEVRGWPLLCWPCSQAEPVWQVWIFWRQHLTFIHWPLTCRGW